MHHETVPGLSGENATKTATILTDRLNGLIDLQLTLKHIHWNVVGPNFIGVHEMLDDHVGPIRDMTDDVAERIAVLGGTPVGTPGHLVDNRSWKDYELGRGSVQDHMNQLDAVYDGVIADHRQAASMTQDVDPVTEDLLIGQIGQLELFQWFVRSHIENAGGNQRA